MTTAPYPPVDESIHGVRVSDPYRWLEERHLPETEAWIREQRELCTRYFENIPWLDGIRDRVRSWLDVDVIEQPMRVKGMYFYRRRPVGAEQALICVRQVGCAVERPLVDPSQYGGSASINIHRVSHDASLLAFELRRGGEDRCEVHVVDVATGYILPDHLPSGYPRGFAFTSENDGFYYIHATSTDHDHLVRMHRFGCSTPDEVVLDLPRCSGRLSLMVDGSRLGVISLRQVGGDQLIDFQIASAARSLQWSPVFIAKLRPFHPILCNGKILVSTRTTNGNSRVIEISEDGSELRELIPPLSSPIHQLAIGRTRLYASYIEQEKQHILAWSFDGSYLETLDLPKEGTIELSVGPYQQSDDFFYTYESFECPPQIFEYSAATSLSTLWHSSRPVPVTSSHHAHHVTYLSADRTEIPMTLVGSCHKSLSEPSPVVMTSYGGFGIAVTPRFSVLVAILMELGARFALPHIRGGGEGGASWHDSAIGRNRQRSFDDFIGAAECLLNRGISLPHGLAIFGGSNSGLLVGAALTQRPDLFAGAVCIAPLLDMVRYEQFDRAVHWRREYGTIQDPDDFRALYAYSPYHKIQEHIDYPPVMFVSGDKDDRCCPIHVRKMAARMQDRDAQSSEILVDYSEDRGHRPSLPLSERVDALTRRIAFLAKNMKLSVGREEKL